MVPTRCLVFVQTVSHANWRVSQRSSVAPLCSASKEKYQCLLHFQSAHTQRPAGKLWVEKDRWVTETRWLGGICTLTAGGRQLFTDWVFTGHTHHLPEMLACVEHDTKTAWRSECRTTASFFSQQWHHNKNRRTRSSAPSFDLRGEIMMALKICSLDSLSINLFFMASPLYFQSVVNITAAR